MRKTSINYDTIQYFKLTQQPDFIKDVEEIRDRFNKKQGFDDSDYKKPILSVEDLDSEYLYYLYEELEEEADSLIKKYKLSGDWSRAILDYIILGADLIGGDDFKIGGVKIKQRDPDKEYDNVELVLYKNTTLKDIKYSWPEIQKGLDNLPGKTVRKRVQEEFLRDRHIYLLAKEGKTINEIYRSIKREFNEDVDFWVISNSLSKFCKNIGIKPPILKTEKFIS